jgi:hypothetical protein
VLTELEGPAVARTMRSAEELPHGSEHLVGGVPLICRIVTIHHVDLLDV